MAQPAFDTANALQAALPTVLKILPNAITAGVAIYAGANWRSYSRLPHGAWHLLLLAGSCAKRCYLALQRA